MSERLKSNTQWGVGGAVMAVLGVLKYTVEYKLDGNVWQAFQDPYFWPMLKEMFYAVLALSTGAATARDRSAGWHGDNPNNQLEARPQRPVRPGQIAPDVRSPEFFEDFEPDLDIGPSVAEKKTVEQVAIVDMDQLYDDLERDEGVSHAIYVDSLGHPTVGIGHLLTKRDAESSLPVGTKVSHERVLEWFQQDVQAALAGVIKLFPDFNTYPMEVRLVLANMIFQLGYSGLSRFKKTRKFIQLRQWAAAADEMMDSRWASQTPYRAQRHSDRLKSISSTQHA